MATRKTARMHVPPVAVYDISSPVRAWFGNPHWSHWIVQPNHQRTTRYVLQQADKDFTSAWPPALACLQAHIWDDKRQLYLGGWAWPATAAKVTLVLP